MPTAYSALPTNAPIPNGRVQIKRGKADVGINASSLAVGQKITDSGGGFIEIFYTPTYDCWWVVRTQVLTVGISGGWQRCDWAIFITPADMNGVTRGYIHPCQCYDSGTVSWRTSSGSYAFRLRAGVTYNAYLGHQYRSGGEQQYHTGSAWTRIIGRVVGEGFV